MHFCPGGGSSPSTRSLVGLCLLRLKKILNFGVSCGESRACSISVALGDRVTYRQPLDENTRHNIIWEGGVTTTQTADAFTVTDPAPL